MPASDTSRSRLLAAGKALFARLGYESTPTSALAREAGTSESQLVRHFGGKSGLLDAILDDSWTPLNVRVTAALAEAPDGRAALLAVLSTILSTFARDADLATIFLFEGRRIRGEGHDVRLSSGFVEFAGMVQKLIRRAQKDGSLTADLDGGALCAALMGATEGLLRERLLGRRNKVRTFSDQQLQRVVAAMLDGLAPRAAAVRARRDL